MPKSDQTSEILEHSDFYINQLIDSIESAPQQIKQMKRFEKLKQLITVLEMEQRRELLEKLLLQVRKLNQKTYDTNKHIGLIIYLENVTNRFHQTLVNKLILKLQNLVRSESRYLKMKHQDNNLYVDVCNNAIASIDNLTPLLEKPTEQQIYANVLLNEIIDYRYSTLSNDQSWDFVAQMILDDAKTTPS